MKSFTLYQISYGYVSELLDYETFKFWKELNVHSLREFSAKTLFLEIIACLLFQGLNDHRFLYNLFYKLSIISCMKVQNWVLIRPFLSIVIHA